MNILKSFSFLFMFLSISMASSSDNIKNLMGEYCNKENAFNGVGMLSVITERYTEHSYISSDCTASLVEYKGHEFILTAAHCLEHNKAVPKAEDVFFSTNHGCGEPVFKSVASKVFVSPGTQEYLFETKLKQVIDHDWGIVLLKEKAPSFIKRYKINFENKSFKSVLSVGFPGVPQSDGYPKEADGQTLVGIEKSAIKLKFRAVISLTKLLVQGMSGGPIFELDSEGKIINIIGVNSHCEMLIDYARGIQVYTDNSSGAFPTERDLRMLLGIKETK